LKRISGRTADTIVLKDGSKVHGVFFTDILNDLFTSHPDFVHRFQVYQNVPGEIDFRIESTEAIPAGYHEMIYEALNRFFKKVSISPMPFLPSEETGKFRYIISDLS
jgi:phenylacetate-CoA ligase